MASMYEVLELIRMRPSMYIGGDDSRYDLRLADLETLIAGYSLAVHHHGLKDDGWEAYARFPSYLHERFGWSMSCGPIVAIRDVVTSDREAWDLFWKLVAEFRDSARALPPAPQSHQWRAPYRIETARLNLCALGPEHVDQLHEVVPKNKAHLESSMPWVHAEPLSYDARTALLTQMRSDFDLGVDFVLGIFERSSNRYIGGTGLHPRVGPHALEIGYWIAADAQGKGLVTEAVVALVSVALETMGARRLEIRCSPANVRSRAIPERLGFQLDGILRDGGLSGSGELEDKMVWSLLAKEYPQRPLFTAPRPTLFDVLDRPIEL